MVPRFDEADSLIASVLYRTGIFSQAEKVVAPAFVLRISARLAPPWVCCCFAACTAVVGIGGLLSAAACACQ